MELPMKPCSSPLKFGYWGPRGSKGEQFLPRRIWDSRTQNLRLKVEDFAIVWVRELDI